MSWSGIYDVKHAAHGNVEVIEVPEDFDVYSAPSVREAVIAARKTATSYVFDLGETRYMDSTGLGVMVGALKWAREQRGGVVVARIGARQLEVLNVTGLIRLIPAYETVADALAALEVVPS